MTDERLLSTSDHDRASAGALYVYPVVSRRAGGVSVGVNLNPNNACNWRCIYCQVPDLVFGSGPPLDLDRLERELEELLRRVTTAEWMERHVPEGARRLVDVALSGNGEPTGSPDFEAAIERIERVLARLDLLREIEVVLITNGSLVHKPEVQRGLAHLARIGGAVWFKLDSATAEGQARLNDNRAGIERSRANLDLAASLCPTWIQTMVLSVGGSPPSALEQERYLDFVGDLVRRRVPLRGVLLYGLARTSHQPEARELAALPGEWLESFSERIRAAGLAVRTSP